MPIVGDNISRLRRRHYVRNATAVNHWFDFMATKASAFSKRFGDDFCLVINGSHVIDDAYIIPYSIASQTFTRNALDHRGRWIGTIENDQLVLVPSHNTLRISSYHNAFHYLGL